MTGPRLRNGSKGTGSRCGSSLFRPDRELKIGQKRNNRKRSYRRSFSQGVSELFRHPLFLQFGEVIVIEISNQIRRPAGLPVLVYPVNRKVDLPEKFDALFYPPDLETVPKRLAIVRANRYMVERSDFLIAYVRHPASNARELLEYAGTGKRKGKIHITNLAEEQISLSKKTDDMV